jgi:D-alanyl-D-alanine-carboxypeptidase/D-alanyl-D-alanine-endopeptidase
MRLQCKKDQVGNAVHRFYESQRPAGMIVGVLPSRGEYADGYWSFPEGFADPPKRTAPDNRTIWQIGSITKTFTATLLAAAVRDLSISLSDDAQNFAPIGINLPTYETWQAITPIQLVQLATHTAGLPMDPRDVSPGGYPASGMYRYLNGYALALEPGTSWNYSNLGFGLLANILIALYGAGDFQDLVQHLKAMGRLGMPDTVVALSAEQKLRRSLGYVNPDLRARWQTFTWPALDGSGALYSTLDDQMTWLAYTLGWLESPINDLLPTIKKLYFEDGEVSMALAWQYSPLPGTTRTYIGKSGNTNGFTSFTALDAEATTGVVVLCNTVSVWPQPLAEEILRLMVQ